MAQGSGSSARLGVLLGILLYLLAAKPIFAAEYKVGDTAGWTYNVENWPNGKSFKDADLLIFNYFKERHNVAVLTKEGYDSCTAPSGSIVYQTGHDEIRLDPGQSYFICTTPGHCENGMKIAINASDSN
ncbi:basic blue protein-like [Chenopodium quinoa]|uniref:basic blue protein-like n=1 Tax=Chenopodium quinoa TaxID=63459 RepID=UPI000B7900B9|nr:basic blue protein-like [Chenopodium quinoa]